MNDFLKVLLVEDNPGDAHLIEVLLAEGEEWVGNRFVVQRAIDLAGALACLSAANSDTRLPDVVMLDLSLPDSQGLDTLLRLARQAPLVPVVVLTGLDDQELAMRALQAGAQDYLVKGQGDGLLLARSVRYAVERLRAQQALARRAGELAALYDTSLEINSQTNLDTLLNAIVARAARLVQAPIGALYLLDARTSLLRLHYVYNLPESQLGSAVHLGEGLAGRIAASGQPLALADYQAWESQVSFPGSIFRRCLGVPLQVGGRVMGVIILADDVRVGPVSDEEVRLVRMFADQAAIAVEKGRLYEAERQRSQELAHTNALIAALSQVASRLETTFEPEQVMNIIGQELKLLGVTSMIALRGSEGCETDSLDCDMEVRYTSIAPEKLALIEQQAGTKFLGTTLSPDLWVMRSWHSQRRPIFQGDLASTHRLLFADKPAELVEGFQILANMNLETAAIYLPLVIKDNLAGMLAVWSDDLRENDVPAFSVFANQVAVALENVRLYGRVQQMAILDDLTRLYNRRGFYTLADQQMRLARRSGFALILLFIDLDHLKSINDNFGHSEGDKALVDTAEVLRRTFRASDIVARMGGDEFAVLTIHFGEGHLDGMISRLMQTLGAMNAIPGRHYKLSMSIGAAGWHPDQSETLDDLLSRADELMYEQKKRKHDGEKDGQN